MNITDAELNLAMCELDGWKKETRIVENKPQYRWIHPIHGPATLCGGQFGHGWGRDAETQCLPNYLSPDSPRRLLDEAEARLTDTEYLAFNARLNGAAERFRNYVSATARQRVIAILRVVKPEMFQ